MLVISPQNIHILCGFIVKNPSRVKKIGTTADCVLEWMSPQQQQDVFDSLNSTNVKEKLALDLPQHDTDWVEEIWKELLRSDLGYSRFPLSEVYSFFRRRYQLKYTAMEVTDVKGYSALYSCESVEENEEVLVRLLQSDLPNSIFNQIGLHQLQLLRSLGGNASSMCRSVYNRLVHLFVTQVTALWKSGELSNFEYLMQINAAAGRSFQDLTQYPVFPWIIADYTSNTLDLEDPRTFRDLTKPMGAIGSRRAQQYRDRYQTMDEFYKDGIEGSSPPFFYGTHYSCAGYVLHYLLRLQPYADMNVSLQGGQFDKADRLFLSVESSWASASSENLQDVRELIPEFFYLPEFLTNLNNFDLGSTQRDEMVKDVTLPPWAHGDPHQFIRLHREALECKYVSENLHHWVDLVFGFKQRGPEAVDSLNVFIHLTYEGEVDIDTIMDPVMKVATISQINNFGQTPLRVFRKPHPPKSVPDIMKRAADSLVLDPWAIAWHTHLSPPLSVVGAPEHSMLSRSSYAQVLFPGNVRGLPVGDVRIVRGDRLVAVPSGSALVPPLFRRAVRIGPYAGAVSMHSIHPALAGARALDSEKELSVHEELHVKPITCLAMAKNGAYFATGGEDTSVRVWRVSRQNSQRRLLHVCTLAGHTAAVMCLDISTELSVVVSGGADSIVCVWDYRMKRMLRILEHSGPLLSVSLNPIGAMIGTLTATQRPRPLPTPHAPVHAPPLALTYPGPPHSGAGMSLQLLAGRGGACDGPQGRERVSVEAVKEQPQPHCRAVRRDTAQPEGGRPPPLYLPDTPHLPCAHVYVHGPAQGAKRHRLGAPYPL
ncbi:BEACH domain-containing protein [Ochromonadaceae sp. CCMP2298]|nr:BEACH domain-containing protein [Ochromonadaceae sp. CCMP2298]